MNFYKAKNSEQIKNCYELLKELRTNLSYDEFHSLYDEANKNSGYEFIYAEKNKELIGLIGYRILVDFVHGRHLYIDDLVVKEGARSQGNGAELLNYAEALAREYNCKGLRLCTGVDNKRAVQFYERCGWQPRAYAFKKKLVTAVT